MPGMTTPTQGGSAAASPPDDALADMRDRQLRGALVQSRQDLYLQAPAFRSAIDALTKVLPQVVEQLADGAEARLELQRRQAAEIAKDRSGGTHGLEAKVAEHDVVMLYIAADGWRWRYLVAGIGGLATITADGGQGYRHLEEAIAGAARVLGVDPVLLEQTGRGELEAVGRAAGPGDEARPVALIVQGRA